MTTDTLVTIRKESDDSSFADIDPQEVARALRTAGSVAIRGFDASLDDFVSISDAICADWHDYRGGGFRFGSLDRATVDTESSILTATGSTQTFPVPLHGEMYYFQERPQVLWFYCQVPPAGGGGETTVCDGAELLAALPEEVREYLRAHDLVYHRRLEGSDWRQAFMTENLDEIDRICQANNTTMSYNRESDVVTTQYRTSAIVIGSDGTERLLSSLLPVWFGEQIADAGTAGDVLHEESGRTPPIVIRTPEGERVPEQIVYAVYAVGEALEQRVDWQPGEILAVNNTTTAHGRTESQDPDRLIYVRMGQFAT